MTFSQELVLRCAPSLLGALSVGALLLPSSLQAADVYLVAGKTTITLPDGQVVPMWAYGQETDGNFTTLEATLTVPGPRLVVPPGDSVLNIHLYNKDLPEPVSVLIPSLYASLQPVFFTDAQGRRRVRSMTAETPMGSSHTYSWSNVTPGTYLYHSGTHPALQVQMGLYGAMTSNTSTQRAYPGVPFDRELVQLYSELDVDVHEAAAQGTYGTPAFPSAFEYHPTYFLVNGQPSNPALSPLPLGEVNQRVLVRFLNAGLREHVPTLVGEHMAVLAEDGNRYPFQKELYGVMLGAGKTMDVLFKPTVAGDYTLFDRALDLTSGGEANRGLMTRLHFDAGVGTPVANNDTYVTGQLQQLVVNAPGVLINDSDPNGDPMTAVLLESVAHGSLSLNSSGAFVYTPAAGYSGTDSFSYRAQANGQYSNEVRVVLYVERLNRAPVAQTDSYSVAADGQLVVPAPGVLANDSDPDGDPLTATLESVPTLGEALLGSNGSFEYTPFGDPGTEQLRYTATDGVATSAEATIQVAIQPPSNIPPVANDDYASTKKNVTVVIPVVANDVDADGFVEPATVQVVNPPSHGTVSAQGDGTLRYIPASGWRGTDVMTYLVYDNAGAASDVAVVRVNVVR